MSEFSDLWCERDRVLLPIEGRTPFGFSGPLIERDVDSSDICPQIWSSCK